MKTDNKRSFEILSKIAEDTQKRGDFEGFAQAHKDMANILNEEENYQDEIRSRILAYYFDASGISCFAYIDKENIYGIETAMKKGEISEEYLERIYFDIIRKDTAPKHTMTVNGSYKLLLRCIRRQWGDVNRILFNLK